MDIGAIVALTILAVLLSAACWYLFRHRPSAADERRAIEESRVRAQHELTDIQRRPGTFGGR